MSRASRPGRVLVIAQDAASGHGHAQHDADEVTVAFLTDGSAPKVDGYDQVLVVGIADPVVLAELLASLSAAPQVLVGGGVSPVGSLADWSAALGGIGVAGFDDGALALAIIDPTGSGAGPALYGMVSASVKVTPRLVAPPREETPPVADEPAKKQPATPPPAQDGARTKLTRLLSSPATTARAATVAAVVVAAVVAVLAGVLGDAVIGAVLGLILVVVVAAALRAELRKTPATQPQQLRRLEKLVERQTELLETHSEQLAALRTSTSINELATVDIAKSLVRDVS